jgi:hypothetical protein
VRITAPSPRAFVTTSGFGGKGGTAVGFAELTVLWMLRAVVGTAVGAAVGGELGA